MAGNYLTLHTNDRVVVTTSRGNQEKWFDAEKNLWYKVDDGCFEALAEAVSSEVLRNFTNAVQLPGISVANYWADTAGGSLFFAERAYRNRPDGAAEKAFEK